MAVMADEGSGRRRALFSAGKSAFSTDLPAENVTVSRR
jgi:hypothetical protein